MPDRINVALVISDLHEGGAERLLVDLIAAWQQHNEPINPLVYTLRDGPIRGELESQGCPVSSSPFQQRINLLIVAWLVKCFLHDRIHLAHLHLPRAGFYGRLAARLLWVPVLYTEHNLWEMYNPLSRFLNRSTYFLNTSVATVSDAVSASVHRHSRYAPSKLARIYNGISPDNGTIPATPASVRNDLNLPSGVPIVGTIANLHPRKGLQFLLYAVWILRQEFPDLHCVIIGRDDGAGEDLQALAQHLGIDGQVHMLGYQKKASRLLSAFDIFALPSLYEGLPIALIEAMEAGLPVVATRVGGNPELIAHEETGLLVAPENATDLATAIRTLLLDSERRTRLGIAARYRIRSEFTVASMANKYAELYRTIVNGAPVR